MEIPNAALNYELILRLCQVRLKRLSLHTQAVTPTQLVAQHTNILMALSSFCVGHFMSACPFLYAIVLRLPRMIDSLQVCCQPNAVIHIYTDDVFQSIWFFQKEQFGI